MRISMNHLMSELYSHVVSYRLDDIARLDDGLRVILEMGFVTIDDCILLASEAKRQTIGKDFHVVQSSFRDRIDCESFINHIHVDDELKQPVKTAQELLEQGIAFAKELSERVYAYFPAHYQVIVSIQNDELLDCTVRFVTVRDNEPPYIAGDIDKCIQPVFIIET